MRNDYFSRRSSNHQQLWEDLSQSKMKLHQFSFSLAATWARRNQDCKGTNRPSPQDLGRTISKNFSFKGPWIAILELPDFQTFLRSWIAVPVFSFRSSVATHFSNHLSNLPDIQLILEMRFKTFSHRQRSN